MTSQQAAPELNLTRIFDAPRDLVFRCMITPEHLTHFWGPAGVSAPLEHIRVDARPGGVFETVMVSDADGSTYPTRAVYVEVTEPERLVWTETRSGMTDGRDLRRPRRRPHRGPDQADGRARRDAHPAGPGRLPHLTRQVRRLPRLAWLTHPERIR